MHTTNKKKSHFVDGPFTDRPVGNGFGGTDSETFTIADAKEGDTYGNYTVTSSAEFGARGLSVNGNHEKYQSDLNYHAGARLFNSSFFIKDNNKSE